MRSVAVSVAVVALLLAALMCPAHARYLPTKRGSLSGSLNASDDRLERLSVLINELLGNAEAERPSYDQRVFYKREAPAPLSPLQLQRAAAAAAAEYNSAPLM